MKRTSRLIVRLRIRVWLPLCGSLILFWVPALSMEVLVEDGLISIEAEQVTVQEVLDVLVDEHHLRLVQESPLQRRISVSLQRQSLEAVLDHLLETSDSYQLYLPPYEYADEEGRGAPGVLWLFAEGSDNAYVIEFLETVLMRGSISEQRTSIRDLRDIGTPAAVQSLSFALGDTDRRVRKAAIEALTAIGSEEALVALASSVGAEQPLVRAAAAEALAEAGGESATSYLDIALSDDDPRVRMAAAAALGDLGGEAARTRLRTALADPDPAVRERAVEILEDLDDEAMFRALFPPE